MKYLVIALISLFTIAAPSFAQGRQRPAVCSIYVQQYSGTPALYWLLKDGHMDRAFNNYDQGQQYLLALEMRGECISISSGGQNPSNPYPGIPAPQNESGWTCSSGATHYYPHHTDAQGNVDQSPDEAYNSMAECMAAYGLNH